MYWEVIRLAVETFHLILPHYTLYKVVVKILIYRAYGRCLTTRIIYIIKHISQKVHQMQVSGYVILWFYYWAHLQAKQLQSYLELDTLFYKDSWRITSWKAEKILRHLFWYCFRFRSYLVRNNLMVICE